MSKTIEIKTNKEVEILEICKNIADKGYGIALKEGELTNTIYMPYISIREIEITTIASGYEVKINFLACKEDYYLFRDVVDTIMQITGANAFYEFDDKVKNALTFFNDEFVDDVINNEFNVLMAFLKNQNEIGIFPPFRPFYLGQKIYNEIIQQEDILSQQNYLLQLIRSSQYEDMDKDDSPTFVIARDGDDEENRERISVYKLNEYRFIRFADYFSLMEENGNHIIIKYSDLHQIVPSSWVLFDEKQYKTNDLTILDWNNFWKRAEKFKITL